MQIRHLVAILAGIINAPDGHINIAIGPTIKTQKDLMSGSMARKFMTAHGGAIGRIG